MSNRFHLCFCAIALIVVLRVAIGWHFFYEGLHKFDPTHEFSSKGFLGVAKGPTADLYFAFLPDLNGTERLAIADKTVKNAAGKDVKVKTFPEYETAFENFKARYDSTYAGSLTDEQKARADKIYNQYLVSLRDYAVDNETDIRQFLGSLARFEEKEKRTRDVAHIQERNWSGMMGYRAESAKWVNALDAMGSDMANALMAVYNAQHAGDGKLVTQAERAWIPNNPIIPTQIGVMDMAVSVGLTAIGLCMILGFCNRLACLGGAAFLVNVWLVQFPFPGVYPELPDMIGHFMGVSKDFVELLALLVLAAMPAGRWGGLDYFLYYTFGGRRLAARFGLDGCCCCKEKNATGTCEKKV
ncbi:MAG: hypothetical protein LBU65_09860 [Planctomycetaceae bacterium]|jgi:uncharacterized membrane protein YphA (DoxX/SURF4 family)|nr:hypothetical protein [Planctomycetaceae bacterium]